MKELKGIKIGKYYIEKPIVQGGLFQKMVD